MEKLISMVALIVGLVSCRLDKDPVKDDGPLHIVATTGIIADGLNHIVGDKGEVTSIMGPGTDPHIYKPTPGDIELLEEADVIVANGLHLEGKMAEMLEKYGREKPVIFISEGIPEKQLIKSADLSSAFDPHIWFDSRLWMMGLQYVASELGKIDSSSHSQFEKNLARYQAEIDAMDSTVRVLLGSLDTAKRVLVTSHDAFSYFGRRYDVEVKGIQGISTLSEVGLRDISDMVDFVVDRKIATIFIETSASNRTAQSIVDGAGAKRWDVSLAGPLYSDALGEPGTAGGTYIGMIIENVNMIVNGLR